MQWGKFCGHVTSWLHRESMYLPQQSTRTIRVLFYWQKTSSSKCTRHLNVRYYFITDQIKKGHVKVAFCPTQDMVADFFTKPLQGNLFVRMRERILNLPASKIASVHRSVLEQRGAGLDKAKAREKNYRSARRKNDRSAEVDKTQWQE